MSLWELLPWLLRATRLESLEDWLHCIRQDSVGCIPRSRPGQLGDFPTTRSDSRKWNFRGHRLATEVRVFTWKAAPQAATTGLIALQSAATTIERGQSLHGQRSVFPPQSLTVPGPRTPARKPGNAGDGSLRRLRNCSGLNLRKVGASNFATSLDTATCRTCRPSAHLPCTPHHRRRTKTHTQVMN